MNSIYDPSEVNALNDIQRLVYEVYQKYEEERASAIVGTILRKMANGGSYHDIYEYVRKVNLEKIFKNVIDVHEFATDMEQYDELAREFMKVLIGYSQDINDIAELVQKSLNDSLGIGIKPKQVKPTTATLEKVARTIVGINDDEQLDLMKFSAELIDSIIVANAELQAKSGFNIVVVRRYDDIGIHDYDNYADASKRKTIRGARECPFCIDREGVYEYEATKKDKRVWQRHPGCSCSIDFVNKGMTERVKNYIGL